MSAADGIPIRGINGVARRRSAMRIWGVLLAMALLCAVATGASLFSWNRLRLEKEDSANLSKRLTASEQVVAGLSEQLSQSQETVSGLALELGKAQNASAALSQELSESQEAVANLSERLAESQQAAAKGTEQAKAYAALLENYQQLVRSYQEQALKANLSINATPTSPLSKGAWLIAPALVGEQVGPFQVQYKGIATNLSLEMIPGKGRVLVSTRPVMGEVFQDTAVLAKETAEQLAGVSLAEYDLIFSISAPVEIPAVDGPSAGAAMCLLVLSLIEGRSLEPGVALTGTISSDGTIGAIGGLVEKAQAAKDACMTVFALPDENSELTIYKVEQVTVGRRVYNTLVPVEVSAEEYIETNVGIQVELVKDMVELLQLATAQEG